MIARRLRNISNHLKADAYLFHLDPPYEGHEWVVCSAKVEGATQTTVIYASDDYGTVNMDSQVLSGRLSGVANNELLLRTLGYEVH